MGATGLGFPPLGSTPSHQICEQLVLLATWAHQWVCTGPCGRLAQTHTMGWPHSSKAQTHVAFG